MWIVDTCLVLDVFEHDPSFGRPSADLLQKLSARGLAVSPITTVELSAAFTGDPVEQKRFLELAGLSYVEPGTATDTEQAHSAWSDYVTAKRLGKAAKKPVADILIGAFAANRTGLITRNARDFTRWFPKLKVREP